MDIDEIINEEKKIIAEQAVQDEQTAPAQASVATAAQPIVSDELSRARQEVAKGDSFQKASHEVAARDMRAVLDAEALAVLTQEQQNQLREYALRKERERLAARARYERKIDREEVRAEVYARKVATAEAMYGRYYKQEIVETLDKDGNTIRVVRYKNFTTNTFVNKLRVFANWYNNLAEGSRKIIWTTVKIVLFCGILVGIGFGLYGLVKWLANSGILNQFMQGNNADKIAQFIQSIQ